MRAVQAGPATGLIAQVLLLAALAGTVGLGGAGWVVGVTCGVIANAALARGLSRYRSDRLGPADWVTLARATLAVGVAALTADSFDQPAPVTMLVTLTVVALALDCGRRMGRATQRDDVALGARFDGEVDAFLILVLSVYVARSAGAWVLAIGAARYAFLAAGWLLPWLREPLPPRYWRKVVAVTQGIVLTIAAADVLPLALTQAALVVALALLAESFGRDVWWLWTPPARCTHRVRPRMRANTDRRGAHDPRRSARVGRPRRSRPAESSHAQRVRESPARGPRPHRSGPRPARHRSTPSGLDRRTGSWSRGDREDPRLRLLHDLRPAVRPRRRLELRRDRHRDDARLDRWDAPRTWPSSARRCSAPPSSSSRPWRCFA